MSSPYGQFIVIVGYVHVFKKLNFVNTTSFTLYELRERASEICALNHSALLERFNIYETKDHPISFKDIDVKKEATAEQLCFLSAYAFATLHYGHGFELNRNFTVMETMEYGGSLLKVGWQLGAILYEINALPWTYEPLDSLASSPAVSTNTDVLIDNGNDKGKSSLANWIFFGISASVLFAVFKWQMNKKHSEVDKSRQVQIQLIRYRHPAFSDHQKVSYQTIS
jgi:hypothetical protein